MAGAWLSAAYPVLVVSAACMLWQAVQTAAPPPAAPSPHMPLSDVALHALLRRCAPVPTSWWQRSTGTGRRCQCRCVWGRLGCFLAILMD